MRELSILIKVTPLRSGVGSTYTFMADEFDFVPQPEDTDAGRCYVCDKDIVCQPVEADVIRAFGGGIWAKVQFRDTRGRSFTIGTDTVPALVSLSPNLNTLTLQIRCRMRTSPLA